MKGEVSGGQHSTGHNIKVQETKKGATESEKLWLGEQKENQQKLFETTLHGQQERMLLKGTWKGSW